MNFNSPLASAGGANVVPQVLGSLIDTLYQRSTIPGLNPTMIETLGDLDLPKKTSNASRRPKLVKHFDRRLDRFTGHVPVG